MRRMATEIEHLKTDNFPRTEIVRQFSMNAIDGLRDGNKRVFNSRNVNTEAIKPFNMERPSITKLASEPVAFSAYIFGNQKDLRYGQIIIFDSVYINVGDGYNKSSGVFIAPSAGVYFFTWTIYSGGQGITKFGIYKNDAVRYITYSDTEGTENSNSNSGAMVVEMQAHREFVYIRSGMNCTASIISDFYQGVSTFAGWKLF